MMRKSWKLLQDILSCIDDAEKVLTELQVGTFEQYLGSRPAQLATERLLSIIGEAVNRLTKQQAPVFLDNYKGIVDMRNHIVHSYDEVSPYLMWDSIQKDLPILRAEVEALLKQ